MNFAYFVLGFAAGTFFTSFPLYTLHLERSAAVAAHRRETERLVNATATLRAAREELEAQELFYV